MKGKRGQGCERAVGRDAKQRERKRSGGYSKKKGRNNKRRQRLGRRERQRQG